MSYPMLVNWVDFEIQTNNKVVFKDMLSGDCYTFDYYTAWFISNLDGKTNPYEIDKDLPVECVDELLNDLDEMELLRHPRVYDKSFVEIYLTLWIPYITKSMRSIAHFVNFFLRLLWLPVLVTSIVFSVNKLTYLSDKYVIIGLIIGLLVGIVFHEFGHMCACLSYGGQVFEFGVFLKFLIPGAYVLMDDTKIKSRMKKVQIYSAGVETNLFLAGIFLSLCVCFPNLSGMFFGAFSINIVNVLLNLILADGLDGMEIMTQLLGTESLDKHSRRLVRNKSRRAKLSKNRLVNKGYSAVCCIINVLQISISVIIILSVFEEVLWFL